MSARFRLTLKGDEADDSLRLSDLIDQLNAVKNTLNQIDMAVSGRKAPGLYYRITALSMNSPATIEVEAVASKKSLPNYGRKVVSKFQRDLKSVIRGKRPKDAGLDLMDSYKGLAHPQRGHVAGMSIQFEKENIEVPRNLDMKVDEILGPDQTELGSIVGSLEVINIHNQRNEFKVFPIVGPASIKCRFPSAKLGSALAGINHFVRITGTLHYKRAEKFPHFVQVESIEVLPEQSDVPKLSSLRGIAKGAYDGLSSTDYISKVRNGEW
ncbi:hypothetical protein [Variovorax sp. dw_954]|uniref:hypothetical protein n=1 Tax=Variovorax sp. dw_954 TaxID=2720078 RepID=UPI001BD27B69|nr:hypothetical protein [Variovorax sp. dw_954]